VVRCRSSLSGVSCAPCRCSQARAEGHRGVGEGATRTPQSPVGSGSGRNSGTVQRCKRMLVAMVSRGIQGHQEPKEVL
jgi:hypothetical protein